MQVRESLTVDFFDPCVPRLVLLSQSNLSIYCKPRFSYEVTHILALSVFNPFIDNNLWALQSIYPEICASKRIDFAQWNHH